MFGRIEEIITRATDRETGVAHDAVRSIRPRRRVHLDWPELDVHFAGRTSVSISYQQGAFLFHLKRGEASVIEELRFDFEVGGGFVSEEFDSEVVPTPGELLPRRSVELILLEKLLRIAHEEGDKS